MPAIYLSDILRVRDRGDGKWAVDWFNSATQVWEEKIRVDSDTGEVELIGAFVQDVAIKKDTPKLLFEGTETGGRKYSYREDAGKAILKDETAGVDIFKIDIVTGDVEIIGEPIIPAGKGIQGRDYSGTAQTVTETAATLKDSCAPTGNKKVLYPLNIVVDSSNPTGSLVTLNVEVKLLHSDGAETTIESYTVAEGTTDTKDYAASAIAKALKDGVSATEARVYAYCSAAPAAGYEPSVTLTSVKALQF